MTCAHHQAQWARGHLPQTEIDLALDFAQFRNLHVNHSDCGKGQSGPGPQHPTSPAHNSSSSIAVVRDVSGMCYKGENGDAGFGPHRHRHLSTGPTSVGSTR